MHDTNSAAAFSSTFIAEKAVSSPPMVSSRMTFKRRREITTFSRYFGSEVGFERDIPM